MSGRHLYDCASTLRPTLHHHQRTAAVKAVRPLNTLTDALHARTFRPVTPARRLIARYKTTAAAPRTFDVGPTLHPRNKQSFGEPLRAQLHLAWFIAPLALLGALIVYQAGPEHTTHPANEELLVILNSRPPAMADLPGRPGNLTPEEEEKLQQFWQLLFQIFQVQDPTVAAAPVEEKAPAPAASSVEETPKKSRFSFFGSKKGKADSEAASVSSTSGTTTPKILDIKGDEQGDKYGQNKQFLDTLATIPAEKLRSSFWSFIKMDHPDAIMLRFLRARKWDIRKAMVMLISTLNWRITEGVDDEVLFKGEEWAALAEKGDDEEAKKLGADFMSLLRKGESYCHGIDKTGRPMCFCRVRVHNPSAQSQKALERFTIYLIETARFMLEPPIDTACIVFDMTDFGRQNMDMTPVRFMIKCFEANYPESLGVVLIHSAPTIFELFWKIIKPLLDPVVAAKVNFTKTTGKKDEERIDGYIEQTKLPKELEGKEDWAYEYVEPVPGENDKMKDTATKDKLLATRATLYGEFEQATFQWASSSATPEKKAEAKSEREAVAKKMKASYWELDPYVRARSLYDRVGAIKPDGSIDWYGSAAKTSSSAAAPAVETNADDVD